MRTPDGVTKELAEGDATAASLRTLRERPGITPAMRRDIDAAIIAMGRLQRINRAADDGALPVEVAALQARLAAAEFEQIMRNFSERVLLEARARRDGLLRGADIALLVAVASSVVIILGLGLLFVVTTRTVSRPLQSLEEGVVTWVQGGAAPGPVDGDDELGRIARAFGDFAANLQSALDDVRAAIAEQQVAADVALSRVSAQADAIQRAEGQATEAALEAASGLMATDLGLAAIADMRAAAGGVIALSDQLSALAVHLQRALGDPDDSARAELRMLSASVTDYASGFRDEALIITESADECAATVSHAAAEKEDLAAAPQELSANIAESNTGLADAERSAEAITHALARLERAIARLPG